MRVHIRAQVGASTSPGAPPPRIDDVLVTGPERTFVDLTAHLALVDHVVLGDWLVQRGMVSPARLVSYCRRCRVRRAADAATAAQFVRARVESPQETRLRMLLVLAGLPEPEVNGEVRDTGGGFVARLDHLYREVRLGVEYDGRHHATDSSQWERDVVRRGRLEDLGWRLIVVTANQLHRHPQQVLDQVVHSLRERGFGPLPPPTDDWRAHFSGR